MAKMAPEWYGLGLLNLQASQISLVLTGSVVTGILTLIISIYYVLSPTSPSYAEFPLASLEGKSPKESWFNHGRELMQAALEKVNSTYTYPCPVFLGYV